MPCRPTSCTPSSSTSPPPPPQQQPPPPSGSNSSLAKIPATSLLRGLLLQTVTSAPALVGFGTKLLSANVDTIQRNKPLKWIVDNTFYAHYCAGATEKEINATVSRLRDQGYSGMILAYAREVDLKNSPIAEERDPVLEQEQVSAWLDGTLKTIEYSMPGEFFAVKYTGAGASAMRLLQSRTSFTADKTLESALHEICKAAIKRGVKALMDAEHAALQDGIDAWTLELMRQYNPLDSPAVVYNTYQMYRKISPSNLADHLALAHAERWKLGVKMVRGAYIHSDPRESIWDTKSKTDDVYNDALQYLFSTTTTPALSPSSPFSSLHRPEAKVDLVVASHNRKSALLALDLRSQKQAGVDQLALAQLMGMADDLSMELIHLNNQNVSSDVGDVGVYKYAVWGTTGECVMYLMRRADENKDAVSGGGSGGSGVGFGKVFAEMGRRVGVFSPGGAEHGNTAAT